MKAPDRPAARRPIPADVRELIVQQLAKALAETWRERYGSQEEQPPRPAERTAAAS